MLQSKGVINSPDYWEKVDLQYLNELCSNFIKKVDSKINNGVKTFDGAIELLVSAKVINTEEYWVARAKEVRFLDQLIINMANKCAIDKKG